MVAAVVGAAASKLMWEEMQRADNIPVALMSFANAGIQRLRALAGGVRE